MKVPKVETKKYFSSIIEFLKSKYRISYWVLIFTCFNASFLSAQTSALYFDGVADYATVDIELPADYTFEFYMKFHDLSAGWETILNFNGNDWTPWFGTDNSVGDKFEFWDGSYLFETAAVLENELWYDIALVKHNDKIYIYLNGQRIYTYDGATTALDGPFSIGGQETSYNGNMTIDELRISSFARYTGDEYVTSDCEFSVDADTYALYHFNDGNPSQIATDETGNGHDLRLGTTFEVDDSDPSWIIDGIEPIEVEIIGDSTICLVDVDAEFSYTSEVTGDVINYVWQINGDLQIVSGQGTPAVILESTSNGVGGVADICLTVDVGCGLNVENCLSVEIQAIDEISLSTEPQQFICELDDPINLETTQNNQVGIWSGDGIVSNVFHPQDAGIGIHEIYFSPEDEECAIGTFSIEVQDCDCAGTSNGTAIIDDCGECLEVSDANFNSCLDCAGVPFGLAIIDDCGECYTPSPQTPNPPCDENNIVYIPNVFSPNFDGYNDTFQVFDGQGVVEKIIQFSIYNRWGAAIYHASNFSILSHPDWWDGRFKGENVSEGVYIYFLEIEFTNGIKKEYKGGVTVIR